MSYVENLPDFLGYRTEQAHIGIVTGIKYQGCCAFMKCCNLLLHLFRQFTMPCQQSRSRAPMGIVLPRRQLNLLAMHEP